MALSTAVVLVKLSRLPPGTLAGARLLGGALLLWPLMSREGKAVRLTAALPAAAFLATHFVSWFVGVRLTSVANATLVVNLSPVAMPFALFLLVGERVTRREILGTAVAVAGVAWLAYGSAVAFDRDGLIGDAVCVASMVLATVYLVLARRANPTLDGRRPAIFGYLVPLYAAAGGMCLAWAVVSGEVATLRDGAYDWPREAVLVALLALVPTAFGHSVLNWAMTRMRGQVVAVSGLGQVAFAALLAYPTLGEVPPPAFYPACGLIAAGAVLAILGRRRPAVPS